MKISIDENGEGSLLTVWPAVRIAAPANKTNPKNHHVNQQLHVLDEKSICVFHSAPSHRIQTLPELVSRLL
jgi:hypothetical protein